MGADHLRPRGDVVHARCDGVEHAWVDAAGVFKWPTRRNLDPGMVGATTYSWEFGLDFDNAGGPVARGPRRRRRSISSSTRCRTSAPCTWPTGCWCPRWAASSCAAPPPTIPYAGLTTGGQRLNAVRAEWQANQTDAGVDMAHVVTFAAGGGLAFLVDLNPAFAYAWDGARQRRLVRCRRAPRGGPQLACGRQPRRRPRRRDGHGRQRSTRASAAPSCTRSCSAATPASAASSTTSARGRRRKSRRMRVWISSTRSPAPVRSPSTCSPTTTTPTPTTCTSSQRGRHVDRRRPGHGRRRQPALPAPAHAGWREPRQLQLPHRRRDGQDRDRDRRRAPRTPVLQRRSRRRDTRRRRSAAIEPPLLLGHRLREHQRRRRRGPSRGRSTCRSPATSRSPSRTTPPRARRPRCASTTPSSPPTTPSRPPAAHRLRAASAPLTVSLPAGPVTVRIASTSAIGPEIDLLRATWNDQRPTLTDPSLAHAFEGTAYAPSLASGATDADPDDTLTFTKLDGPAWLTVGPDGAARRHAGRGRRRRHDVPRPRHRQLRARRRRDDRPRGRGPADGAGNAGPLDRHVPERRRVRAGMVGVDRPGGGARHLHAAASRTPTTPATATSRRR